MKPCLALVVICVVAASSGFADEGERPPTRRGFTVSGDGRAMLKDGQPVRVASGSYHYFRDLPSRWATRMRQYRRAGLNAIQTYIPWNYHCPGRPQDCDFSTPGHNLTAFLAAAASEGLMVILRPGPYICAGWDFGGFPAWIVKDNASIALRTSDPVYMAFVSQWWRSQLLPLLRPFMYHLGGPVVMVQVENEYGSAGTDDKAYLSALADMLGRNLCAAQPNDPIAPGDVTQCEGLILLYSTDSDEAGAIARTSIPHVFQAIDFFYQGSANENVSLAWQNQHSQMRPAGPSRPGPNFNGEFYPGWLTHWGDKKMASRSISFVVKTVRTILQSPSATSGLDFYMFFGGTNYGFMAGFGCVTSYDYDAPVSEDGRPNSKYVAVQEVLQKMLPPAPNASRPSSQRTNVSPIGTQPVAYGNVTFTSWTPMADYRTLEWLASSVNASATPLSMEQLGQSYGFTAYSIPVRGYLTQVQLYEVRDYAMVLADGVFAGFVVTLSNSSVAFDGTRYVERILILVDSLGRMNFGPFLAQQARKGLVAPVMLTVLTGPNATTTIQRTASAYLAYTLPMFYSIVSRTPFHSSSQPGLDAVPVIFRGTFLASRAAVAVNTTSTGTYLDMRGWGKGYVYVNGHNLGRYWSLMGPQYSLYCPSEWLYADGVTLNDVIVVEQARWPGAVPFSVNATSFPTLVFSATNFNVRS